MSTRYFQNFDIINYRFGDNEPPALFQNLSTYVDLVDQLKSNISFYEDYTIVSGDRPDTVSFKLYDTDEFYWTFFLLNDKLRESGWPLRREEVRNVAMQRYPHRMVTATENIATPPDHFPVGQVVFGKSSGTQGTIISRNLNLGQLVIDTINTVIDQERTVTIEPNTNGFADIEVLDSVRETFHQPSLWFITKDDEPVSGFEVTIDRLKKTAEIRNIPFEEGAEYELTYQLQTANQVDDTFLEGEILFYRPTNDGLPVELIIYRESEQYNAVHHYERKEYTAVDLDTLQTVIISYDRNEARRVAESLDNGELRENVEWVDIDPYTQIVPAGATAVTYLERLEQKNDDLKQIKVLKPDVVESLGREFYRKIRENFVRESL